MELTIAMAITIINVVIAISNFVSGRKDKAVKDGKEDQKQFAKHDLIEYQLKELKENYKEMSNDIKDIKKMLDNYKDTLRKMIREELNDHVKQYHEKG